MITQNNIPAFAAKAISDPRLSQDLKALNARTPERSKTSTAPDASSSRILQLDATVPRARLTNLSTVESQIARAQNPERTSSSQNSGPSKRIFDSFNFSATAKNQLTMPVPTAIDGTGDKIMMALSDMTASAPKGIPNLESERQSEAGALKLDQASVSASKVKLADLDIAKPQARSFQQYNAAQLSTPSKAPDQSVLHLIA